MKFCFLSERTITSERERGAAAGGAKEARVARVLLDLFRTIYQVSSSFPSVQFRNTHKTIGEMSSDR